MRTPLIILSLFWATIAQAQSPTEKRMYIGPTIGVNSTIVSNPIVTTGPRTGLNVGAKAKYLLTQKWTLNGMLTYSEKGSVQREIPWREIYNYIDFPIMFSYEARRRAVNFYPMLGLHQGFLLKAKLQTRDGAGNNIETNFLTESGQRAQRYEMGVTLGVGSQYALPSQKQLFLDLRYTLGLTNVPPTNSLNNNRNSYLSLNAGVLF